VALDGSRVKANASKHKAMSYGRMGEKQRQLREQVKQLLTQAELADAAADAEYGADRHGGELPAEPQQRESRLKRIREAKRVLEARPKDEAAATGRPVESANPTRPPNTTSPISWAELGPFAGARQRGQLLTKRQVLQGNRSVSAAGVRSIAGVQPAPSAGVILSRIRRENREKGPVDRVVAKDRSRGSRSHSSPRRREET
jgi:hypothetical protein